MFTGSFAITGVTSTLAAIVTTTGIYAIRKYETWGTKHAAWVMSFAAGVLISVSFLHLIPKALELSTSAPMGTLVGFMGIYISNRFLDAQTRTMSDNSDYVQGLIPALGIGFHSFIDGIIYAVAFNVGVLTGILSAIGMVLHEFPEGIVTFVLLKRGGFDTGKASWIAFWAAAASTPLGTLLSYPFIQQIDDSSLGLLLGGSAGVLVYVGATHLLPGIAQEEIKHILIPLILGILVAVIIVLSHQ